MLRFLKNLFSPASPRPPAISVFQVEVTTRCQLHCPFCPKNALGDRWLRGDLPWPLYRDALAPHFAGAEWVYLQGWGEPLLHPHLWDMFKLARDQARHVGFTSNGMLLDENQARRLVQEGGDLIDVSFSGNTAETHESLRRGSRLARIKENVRRLAQVKARANVDHPVIVLSYMLTRPSIEELPDFVDAAVEMGANEVVAINLDYTPNRMQDELKVFVCGDTPDARYEALLQEAARRARKQGLVFRRYPLHMDQPALVCDARPLDTVFINHRGEVAPCTYLGLSVETAIPRLFCSEEHPVSPVSYGNLADGLPAAWRSASARAFKAPFVRRHAFTNPALTFLTMANGDEPHLPPPPPQCLHCHKLYHL